MMQLGPQDFYDPRSTVDNADCGHQIIAGLCPSATTPKPAEGFIMCEIGRNHSSLPTSRPPLLSKPAAMIAIDFICKNSLYCVA